MKTFFHQSSTTRRHHRRLCRLVTTLILLTSVCLARAGTHEVCNSNGIGGGPWSDPQTWHGGVVPTASNAVAISGADTVYFDLSGTGVSHCAGLTIDPAGVLTFRMDGRTNVLTASGPVTVYGTLRADATRDPESRVGLALIAEETKNRTITLMRGGGLLLYGAPARRINELPNVTLSAALGSDASGGQVIADGDVMVDLQRVAISTIQVQASSLDNTGYKPGQRLNIISCNFTNGAAIQLAYCDTALIKNNRFYHGEQPARGNAAIRSSRSTLGNFGNNMISGYHHGFVLTHEVDASLLNNRLLNLQNGIYVHHGQNYMIKGNTISNAQEGVQLRNCSGIVEDLLIEDAQKHGLILRTTTVQVTDTIFSNLVAEAVPLLLDNAAVNLLNVNVDSNTIRLAGEAPDKGYWVQMMNYLVVKLSGKIPPRSIVQVATAEVSGGVPKDGAADLNVRNSPADVGPDGWSPLPATMRPIIVRSWSIKANEKLSEAPFYDLTVSQYQADGTPDPKPIYTKVIEPRDAWLRPQPNASVATLEIKLP